MNNQPPKKLKLIADKYLHVLKSKELTKKQFLNLVFKDKKYSDKDNYKCFSIGLNLNFRTIKKNNDNTILITF